MAEVRISELPDGGTIGADDTFPVVRAGQTLRAARGNVIRSVSTANPSVAINNADPENPVLNVKRTLSIMFNEPGSLTAGEEMRLGNTEGQNNEGWVSPFNGTLVGMTISRGDSDPADFDISVNGVVQATVPSAALKSVETFSVPVNQLDSIMVLGGASTPNPMTQPVVVVLLEES